MAELEAVLKTARNSACGEDGISTLTLKKLLELGKQKLLTLFNTSWNYGRVPTAWKKSVNIKIQKQGKSSREIKSYRPVSLSQKQWMPSYKTIGFCWDRVGKELGQRKKNKIPPEQSGFQLGRLTRSVHTNIYQRAMNGLQEKNEPTFQQLTSKQPSKESGEAVF